MKSSEEPSLATYEDAETDQPPEISRDAMEVDSGSSTHTFNDKAWFVDLLAMGAPGTTASNGSTLATKGIGTVAIRKDDIRIILYNVCYASDAIANLLSPGLLRGQGLVVNGYSDSLDSKSTQKKLFSLKGIHQVTLLAQDGPEKIKGYNTSSVKTGHITKQVDYGIMHRRLMHDRKERVVKAYKGAGIEIDLYGMEDFHCEACHLAKSTKIVKNFVRLHV